MRHLAQFADERVDRVAAGQFGPLDAAAGVEQHRLAQIPPFPADHGEVEHQRRLLQMNFESVRERPALLVDRAAGGFDDQVAIGEAKLRVPEFGQAVSQPAAVVTSCGMPNSRRMKWASWTCRSSIGPPIARATRNS